MKANMNFGSCPAADTTRADGRRGGQRDSGFAVLSSVAGQLFMTTSTSTTDDLRLVALNLAAGAGRLAQLDADEHVEYGDQGDGHHEEDDRRSLEAVLEHNRLDGTLARDAVQSGGVQLDDNIKKKKYI